MTLADPRHTRAMLAFLDEVLTGQPAAALPRPLTYLTPRARTYKRDADGRFGSGEGMRPIKVMDGPLGPGRGHPWQHSDDIAVRSVNIWAQTYDGHRSVVATMRARREGRDEVIVHDDDKFLEVGYAGAKSASGEEYGMDAVRNDIHNAAVHIEQLLDQSSPIPHPLVRGMRVVNPAAVFKPGETFDVDVSSWTTHRDLAETYTRRGVWKRTEADAAPVLMRVSGARGVSVDTGGLETQAGSAEHLLRGQFRITQAQQDGDFFVVDVEQT